ncbi:hypothetical protein J8F10_24620 [Gemmata sp. G18]|uniref:Uncharacterized protein n=1 Tax=Gemmata palustris TaxID=2822762 RepID=A0ABS5BYW3_9BACT|nr:hypothetical protein [Gemmata palustris]MBP3958445.1 hypothetical protein [Gemmata palustris]
MTEYERLSLRLLQSIAQGIAIQITNDSLEGKGQITKMHRAADWIAGLNDLIRTTDEAITSDATGYPDPEHGKRSQAREFSLESRC